MNKRLISLLCLALSSLACLHTAAIADDVKVVATPTFVKVTAESTATAKPSLQPSPAGKGSSCAVVIANEALHLRSEPNEHAAVLAWLKHGDQVKLISTSNADWWLVRVSSLTGFARSIYLEESEC